MRHLLTSTILSLGLLMATNCAFAEDHYKNLADAADWTAKSLIDQLEDRGVKGARILVVDGVNMDPAAAAYYRHQAQTSQIISEAMQSELTRQGLAVVVGGLEDARDGDIVITSSYARGAMETYVNVKAFRVGDGVVVASQSFLVNSRLY